MKNKYLKPMADIVSFEETEKLMNDIFNPDIELGTSEMPEGWE